MDKKLISNGEESDSEETITAEKYYARIVEAFLGNPQVAIGSKGKKGFGSSALTTNGKIFAMLNSKGQFVVKLPKQRVEDLIAAGNGERFDPGHGRLMKEWLVLYDGTETNWLTLAKEALAFVASKG